MTTAAAATAGANPWVVGVSTAVGVVALSAAVLMWFVGDHHPRVAILLEMTGLVGLAASPLGDALRAVVTALSTGLDALTVRFAGTAIAGLAVILCAYVLVVHLFRHKKVTKWTWVVAAVVAVAYKTTPGPVGSGIHTAVGAVTGVTGHAIATALRIK
jgi:hypothetical protein